MIEETVDPASLELEKQLARLDSIMDPAARAAATDLVAAVLEFHGAALKRMLEALRSQSGDPGPLFAAFDRDPLIRSVLLLHDLHPNSLEERVQLALCEAGPRLEKRGASAELLGISEEEIRVRIKVSGEGHGPIAPAIEQAIRAAAPEVGQVIVEESGARQAGFVPLDALQTAEPHEHAARAEN